MVAKIDSEAELTEEEFNEIIKNGHKIVVVDFFAEWCMPCVMLTPVIEELAESEDLKDVKFTKLNVDENQKLAQKYKVSSIPCLIIFKEGKEVDRMIGAQSGEVIEEKIKGYL
jgi:thioredoxin 1